jgi:hypothetical protein
MSPSMINELISDLAELEAPPDTVNIYAWDAADALQTLGNAIRRNNLALALTLALERGPDLLLVGEAPGYNGARRTGVPFTSEQILLSGIEPLHQFGVERGFALATTDGRISREPTATIVYRELAALKRFAVGWNAFPTTSTSTRSTTEQSYSTPARTEAWVTLPRARVQSLFCLPGCGDGSNC